ncbi:MAG: hypothetical protein CL840_15220 [Crocinitomicaceae bacterium]|nr:hypothetical protein [Crocinitomicaceae bacterium]
MITLSKHAYRGNSMSTNSTEFTQVKFSCSNPLPENLDTLKTRLIKAFKVLKSRCKDTGFKDGVKTTSYSFTDGDVTINHWCGDAEVCYTLLINELKQFTYYYRWGGGHVEFKDGAPLASVETALNVLLSPIEDTTDV